MTTHERLTPADLERHFAGPVSSAAVVALLGALRADPDWSLTEYTLDGQLVRVELLYHPSGDGFTLSQPGRQARGA